jgi:hypothetical protein
MTLTVQPHRESLGLKTGQLYIDGQWGTAKDGATWAHLHPATGENADPSSRTNTESERASGNGRLPVQRDLRNSADEVPLSRRQGAHRHDKTDATNRRPGDSIADPSFQTGAD